jgi:ectoine hydroxylase-related dioxygenase (phytanoyl-CoA dioxygenase family)
MTITDSQPQYRDARTSVDRLLECYQQDGVVILEDVFDADFLGAFNAELDERLWGTSCAQGFERDEVRRGFWGARTKRCTGLAQWSDLFVMSLIEPKLLELIDAVFLDHCHEYWLNTGMVVDIGPGEAAQRLHADEGLWPALAGPSYPENLVNCMVALSSFDEDNGATRLVPGSHRWSLEEKRVTPGIEAMAVPAEMRAGSVAVFSGKLLHGGGANRTGDSWRRGMTTSYCMGWLRPEEGISLGFTDERVRQLPDRARYLLGFGSYGDRLGRKHGGLGAYAMLDPNVVLYGGSEPETFDDLDYRY